MPMDKQFISSDVCETLPGVWSIKITYSYYGLYNFEVCFIESSLERALHRLLTERCGNRLRVINKAGVNIDISTVGPQSQPTKTKIEPKPKLEPEPQPTAPAKQKPTPVKVKK